MPLVRSSEAADLADQESMITHLSHSFSSFHLDIQKIIVYHNHLH